MSMLTALEDGLAQMGICLSQTAKEQLCTYGELLLEKNKVMNLTAITQPEAVAKLHFCDCLELTRHIDLAGKSLIDVGCGAGFPGLPLKIACPELDLTLLDSLGKRVDWLETVVSGLGLSSVRCIKARAEEQALQPGYRESFDLASARAVARLNTLAELCLPYVKVGGCFVAMKSADSDPELEEAKTAIKLLGGKTEGVVDYDVPGTDSRHRIIIIRKLNSTPKGYPRRFSKIKSEPIE